MTDTLKEAASLALKRYKVMGDASNGFNVLRYAKMGLYVTRTELEAVQKRLELTQAKLYSLEKGVWRDGEPDKVSGSEWFIAETEWRARVVLRRLDDDNHYDYETAEETFITSEIAQIKRWMQFPDSHFLPPDDLVHASVVEAAVAKAVQAEREACAGVADQVAVESYQLAVEGPITKTAIRAFRSTAFGIAKQIRARGEGK